MAHKAVFFDRDGVLNIDKAYLYKIDELKWIEGALEAITYLTQSGYLVFVVTNQSGIARGYYTVAEMEKLHQYMSDTVFNSGGKIEKFYYCLAELLSMLLTASAANRNRDLFYRLWQNMISIRINLF